MTSLNAVFGILGCTPNSDIKPTIDPETQRLFDYFGFDDKNSNGVIEENRWYRFGVKEEKYNKSFDFDGDGKITPVECWRYLMTVAPGKIKIEGLSALGLKAASVIMRILKDDGIDAASKQQALKELSKLGPGAVGAVKLEGTQYLSRVLEDIIQKKSTADTSYASGKVEIVIELMSLFSNQIHFAALRQIASQQEIRSGWRMAAIKVLAANKAATQELLAGLIFDDGTDFRLKGLSMEIYAKNFSLDQDFLRRAVDKMKNEKGFNYSNMLNDFVANGLPSLQGISNDQLKELDRSNLRSVSWAAFKMLTKRAATDARLMDVIQNSSHREKTMEILLKHGNEHVLPYVCKNLPSFGFGAGKMMLEFADRLQKNGKLSRQGLRRVEAFLEKYKYDLEDDLKKYVQENKEETPVKQMIERLLKQIEYKRRVDPVFIESLKREQTFKIDGPTRGQMGYPDEAARAPSDKNTKAYELNFRILRLPKDVKYVSLYIIDPQGKEWPQNCDARGGEHCTIGLGGTYFRIFLHRDNREVKAYLRYFNEKGKYIRRSRDYTIINPDAREFIPEPIDPNIRMRMYQGL